MSEENKYPFIQYVAEQIAIADGQEAEDWDAYEDLATAAIKAVKDWIEERK